MKRQRTLALLGAVSLVMALGSHSHADSPPDAPSPDSVKVMTGFDARVMEVNRVVGLLNELAEEFPTVASTLSIDYDREAIVQRYKADVAESQVYIAAVNQVDYQAVSIELAPVSFTQLDLAEATIELYESPELAGEVFGAVPQEIGYNDHGLIVTLPKGSPSLRTTAALGVPATVTVATEDSQTDDDEWQTSGADISPWSGGAALNNTVGAVINTCTSGFVWDKWTTREKMGSTAEHCYQLANPRPSAQLWKTPPGSTVGTRYFYNIAADTQLLRAASGTSFAPKVWVGYNDRRTVKSYVSSVSATQVVALYGRNSGYHSTTVLGHFPRTMLDGSTTLLARTNSNRCQSGDSGGPWFYARSDGGIVAAGQHVGLRGGGCEFVQIGTISAALSASVHTG